MEEEKKNAEKSKYKFTRVVRNKKSNLPGKDFDEWMNENNDFIEVVTIVDAEEVKEEAKKKLRKVKKELEEAIKKPADNSTESIGLQSKLIIKALEAQLKFIQTLDELNN